MSTYDADHNIPSSSSSPGPSSGNGNGNVNVNNSNHHQTLNDVFHNFFHTDSGSSEQLPSLDNHEDTTPHAAQLRAMFQALTTLGQQSNENSLPTQLASEIQTLLSSGPRAGKPVASQGASEEFIDSLDRVSKRQLKQRPSQACPICTTDFLSDEFPLVVALPHCQHWFDLECIRPWLGINATCPLCRDEVTKKRTLELPSDDEEEFDDMYG